MYPKDPFKRARINQRLHFDSGNLSHKLCYVTESILFNGVSEVSSEKIEEFYEEFDKLEMLLKDSEYLVDDTMTIADLCVLPTVTSLTYYAPLDLEMYPNLIAWIERLAQLPYYEINVDGLKEMEVLLEKMKDSNENVEEE